MDEFNYHCFIQTAISNRGCFLFTIYSSILRFLFEGGFYSRAASIRINTVNSFSNNIRCSNSSPVLKCAKKMRKDAKNALGTKLLHVGLFYGPDLTICSTGYLLLKALLEDLKASFQMKIQTLGEI